MSEDSVKKAGYKIIEKYCKRGLKYALTRKRA
jgi:hypothetical protein